MITTGNTIRNNVISGNGSGGGIRLTGVANFVQGNRVGTNAAGTSALPNTTSPAGGAVTATSPDNVIGGTKAANRNLISGNSGHGVLIDIGRTSVQGNFIGTDITGTHAIPNGGDGIHLTGGQQTISGQPSAPQRIWFNNGFGIHNQGDQTRFIANSIRGDKLGGIAVGGNPATGSLSIASDRKTVKVKFGNVTHGGLMDIEVFDNPGRRACPGVARQDLELHLRAREGDPARAREPARYRHRTAVGGREAPPGHAREQRAESAPAPKLRPSQRLLVLDQRSRAKPTHSQGAGEGTQ